MRKAPTSLALSFALALAAFGQAPELKYTLTIFVDEGHGTFDVGHVFVELSDGKNRIYRGLYPPESVEDEFGKWSAILASGGQLRDDKDHGWDVKRIYNITKEGFDIAAESILATDLGQNPERWWFNNHCGDFAEAIANFAGVPIHLAWTGSGRDRPPLFGAYLREHGGRLRRPYSVPAHPIEAGDEPSVPARPLAAERGQTGEPGQGDIIISTGHGEIVVHQAAPAAAAAAVPAAAAAAVRRCRSPYPLILPSHLTISHLAMTLPSHLTIPLRTSLAGILGMAIAELQQLHRISGIQEWRNRLGTNKTLQTKSMRSTRALRTNRSTEMIVRGSFQSRPPSVHRCQQNCQQTATKKLARVVQEFA